MKYTIHFVFFIFLTIGITSDAFSRGSTSSSSRSSSSSSRSSSSSSRSSSSSYSKPKSPSTIKPANTKQTDKQNTPTSNQAINTTKKNTAVTATRDTKQSSTIKSTATSNIVKPKAIATSTIDKKKAKAYASQNKVAAQKYGTKASAEKSYREKLTTQNRFNNPTPPPSTPEFVPKTVVINNTTVETSYGRLPGGYYGFGYYDPVTHLMVELAANQMMINEMRMMEEGYGQWDNTGRAVVVHRTSSGAVVIGILVVLGVIVLIILVVAKVI